MNTAGMLRCWASSLGIAATCESLPQQPTCVKPDASMQECLQDCVLELHTWQFCEWWASIWLLARYASNYGHHKHWCIAHLLVSVAWSERLHLEWFTVNSGVLGKMVQDVRLKCYSCYDQDPYLIVLHCLRQNNALSGTATSCICRNIWRFVRLNVKSS